MIASQQIMFFKRRNYFCFDLSTKNICEIDSGGSFTLLRFIHDCCDICNWRDIATAKSIHYSINPSYKQTGNVLNVKTIIVFGGSNSHNDVYWSMRQWYMHLCMNLIHIYSIFGFNFNADTDTGEQRQCTNWPMSYNTNKVCECVSQCKWTNSICVRRTEWSYYAQHDTS